MPDQTFAEFLASDQGGQSSPPKVNGATPQSFSDFLKAQDATGSSPAVSVPHPDAVVQQVEQSSRIAAERLTRPPAPAPEATISAAPPSRWDAIVNALPPELGGVARGGQLVMEGLRQGSPGRALGVATETSAAHERGGTGEDILNLPAALPSDGPGAIHGAAQFISDLSSPGNLLTMAATGGLGALEKQLGRQAVSRLVSAGFSADMLWNAARQSPDFVKQARAGDWPAARETLTKMALGSVMGAAAAGHAFGSEARPGIPVGDAGELQAGAEKTPAAPPTYAEFLEQEDRANEPQQATRPGSTAAAEGRAETPRTSRPLTREPESGNEDQRNPRGPAVLQPGGGREATPVSSDRVTDPATNSQRRVTGSVNVPLTEAGRQQARELAARVQPSENSGQLRTGVQVFTAPNDRSIETGRTISPGAQPADWLSPWKMGQHEGQPLGSERDAINDRIANRPDESPGVSPHSGEQGESFNEARQRLTSGVQQQRAGMPPNGTALNITSGRALQIVDAWAKAGQPADGRVDTSEITSEKAEFSKPGQLFRLDPGGLTPVDRVEGPGQYFAQHGETEWNTAGGNSGRISAEAQRGRPTAGVDTGAARPVDTGTAREGWPVYGTSAAGAGRVPGEATDVLVPGEDRPIRGRYEVRELTDIQPSHNGQTFLPNERYAHQNERDYSKPENQQRVIENSSEERFNPRYHVTDNPDATNGPIVVDEDGNALGGNSRSMILQRVYGRDARGAAAYRGLLESKAAQFGIDPAAVRGMKQPVLVRVVPDEELHALPGGSAWAIRKTNVSGTAQLSASERAAADAGQLAPSMVEHISGAIENAGPDATLNDALTGKSGTAIVNRLISDGFFSEQERPALMDGRTGALTQLAKDRISKAMLGQFFRDSDQIARTPAAVKAKLERIAAPLAKVQGDSAWDLAPAFRESVDLLEYANAHGIRNLNDVVSQQGMFGSEEPWHSDSVKLAEWLRDSKPNDLVSAVRRYVNDREPGMFGASTPADAFAQHFGGVKAERPQEPAGASGVLGGTQTASGPETNAGRPGSASGPGSLVAAAGERGSAPMFTDIAQGLARQGAGAATALHEEVTPPVRDAARAVLGAVRDIQKWAVPSAFDQDAKRFSLELRQNLAEAERAHDRATAALAKARRYFAGQKPEDNYAFVDRVEHREQQPTPWERTLATPIRKLLDDARKQVQDLGTGKLQNFYENYFPHIWQDPKSAAKTFSSMFSRRPFEGGKAFLKKRTFVTFRDGLDAGLKPISDNPVDLVLAKLHEMNRYVAAHKTMQWARENDEAKFVRVGQKAPVGWMKIDDPIGSVQYRNEAGELVKSGDWYMPEGAALILNNHLAPGLAARSPLVRGILGANNVLNQFDLGFSGFHIGTSTFTSVASRAATGFESMLRGHPIAGLGKLLSSPAAPLMDILNGNRAVKEWLNEGAGGGDMGAMIDAVLKAGGRAQNSRAYQTRAAQRFMDTIREVGRLFRHGDVGAGLVKTGKAALLSPFAAADASVWPILDWYVPRLKLGAFIDKARFDIGRLGPNASPEAVRSSLAQTWDSVDNRFGEMVLDNLFWNRIVKDISHMTVRSVGWVLGDVREFGGAATDVARIPAQLASGTPYSAVNLNRLSFVLGYATTTALSSAVYQYLHTGKGPEELRDLIFPRNGEVDQWGRPARSALAAYGKDLWNFAHDPGATLSAKVSPLADLMADTYRNKDFYGTRIRNADDPFMQQLTDELKHVGAAFEPMVAKNWDREKQQQAPPERAAENFFGVGQAPASASQSPAEQLAAKINGQAADETASTPEQTQRRMLRQELTRALRQRQPMPADVTAARRSGLLTPRDVREAITDSRRSYLQHAFTRLELPDALKVWNVATGDERTQIKPMLLKKGRDAMKKSTGTERAAIATEVREALSGR